MLASGNARSSWRGSTSSYTARRRLGPSTDGRLGPLAASDGMRRTNRSLAHSLKKQPCLTSRVSATWVELPRAKARS